MTIEINVGSKLDAKGFKQAETAIDKLNKNAKTLARTFGYSFGTAAVIGFGKASVKAFAEDQKAALSLTRTIENLGLGYGGAALDVNNYISSLEKQTGILDDELRPAMDRLLRATSSITKSQELLGLALDIAAGTGKSLAQVSQSLQKAYLGQTQALGRLGVGLSKAELTSSSFEEIQARLTTLFEGQAKDAAESYGGSLDKLAVAANNAKESLGKDLITALSALGGSGGFPATLKLIESVSAGLGDLIIGVSRFIRDINIIAGKGSIIEKFRKLQAVSAADNLKDMKERAVYGGVYAEQYKAQVAASAKALGNNKKLTAEQLKQLAAKKLSLAIDKANLALSKGTDIFDMDKIQVAAALANQAQQLGKATNAAQALQITNDIARLKVKQDIAALEDAIASKDEKAITAATAKLNEDLKILAVLSNQNVKLADIKSILDSLKPKDLINLDNLNAALAALKLIIAQLGASASLPIAQIPAPVITPPASSSTPAATVPAVVAAVVPAVVAAIPPAVAATVPAVVAAVVAETVTPIVDAITNTPPPTSVFPFPNGATTVEQINANVEALGGVVSVISKTGDEFIKIADGLSPLFQIVEDTGSFNQLVNSFATGTINPFAAGTFRANEGGSLFNSGGGGAFDVNITINTGVGDPNAIAEEIQKILRDAQDRGTIDILGVR